MKTTLLKILFVFVCVIALISACKNNNPSTPPANTPTDTPVAVSSVTNTVTFTLTMTSTITPTPLGFKCAFVSSTAIDPSQASGSIVYFNNMCNTFAQNAHLGHDGSWHAWISTTGMTADSNLAVAAIYGPWYLLDGTTVVAADLNALRSGTISHAININEYGQAAPGIYVVTGSFADGSHSATQDCGNWNNPSAGLLMGYTNNSDAGWSSYAGTSICTFGCLYCFSSY
jgi:hypothetical protein